ncbi:MAG: DNRLRE domain-containing protein [Bryobacterales bacterium]|nr:DNRLRE domain-containing protein [Bryobacterales bacterium]
MRLSAFFLAMTAGALAAADLPVIADVHVGATTPQAGVLPNLAVGAGNRALLRFDLSPLPPTLSPTQVVKATLVFHVNRIATAGPIRLSTLSGPFQELTATQATAPPAAVPFIQLNPVQGLNLFDVTALVQQWITSPASAFGIDIASDPSGGASLLIDSRENTATSFPAEIRVVLSGPAGPQGPAGPTGPQGIQGPAGQVSPTVQLGLCEVLRSSNRPLPQGLECPSKLVFVTNGASPGNFGGLTAADNRCNLEAAAAGRTGTFKAWLSDSTQSPSSRMTQSTVPYRRSDGALVAYNWADLTDGSLHAPILLNAAGTQVGAPILAWTNTSIAGGVYGTFHCQNWTSTNNVFGRGGSPQATESGWSISTSATCGVSARLYCIEQ